MFCPNCGAENQEELAFCRPCGANLQVISQAMKNHLPVVLVSKLDAAIEQKNERFRREAILAALVGAVFLLTTVFVPLGGGFFSFLNILIFMLGIIAIFAGSFNFLAYRRSLELKAKTPPAAEASGKAPRDNILPAENSRTVKIREKDKTMAGAPLESGLIYCPRCRTQNPAAVLYCYSCGASLDFTPQPQGTEKYLPAWLINKLDKAVARNEETGFRSKYKSGWSLLWVAAIYLSNASGQLLGGNIGLFVLYLVLGMVLIVTGGWDLAAYRRDLEKSGKLTDQTPGAFFDELTIFVSVYWKTICAILAFALAPLALAYLGINGGGFLTLFALVVLTATALKFREQRLWETDKRFMSEALPTRELDSPDALPLMPLATVTETTTKPLSEVLNRTNEEPVPTTRNLDR